MPIPSRESVASPLSALARICAATVSKYPRKPYRPWRAHLARRVAILVLQKIFGESEIKFGNFPPDWHSSFVKPRIGRLHLSIRRLCGLPERAAADGTSWVGYAD